MTQAPSLSVCTMARNEAKYLEEWVIHYFSVGVAELRIYDNDSDDETVSVVARLSKHFPVSSVVWPQEKATYGLTQNAAFTDGAKFFAGRSDFVAFVDVDEFLFPAHGESLTDALQHFGADVSAIAINQTFFGSSNETRYRPDLVIKRFTKTAPPDSAASHWVKTIARPERTAPFKNAHWACINSGAYVFADGTPYEPGSDHPGRASRIPADPAIKLHHYGLKSLEEYRDRQLRFSKFQEVTKYSESFFIHSDASSNIVENRFALAFAATIEQRLKEINK